MARYRSSAEELVMIMDEMLELSKEAITSAEKRAE